MAPIQGGYLSTLADRESTLARTQVRLQGAAALHDQLPLRMRTLMLCWFNKQRINVLRLIQINAFLQEIIRCKRASFVALRIILTPIIVLMVLASVAHAERFILPDDADVVLQINMPSRERLNPASINILGFIAN